VAVISPEVINYGFGDQQGVHVATIRPGFNERLYEFCVNFELVTSLGALIAGYVPGIPSPQDESELGWDAEVAMPSFGVTFLFQYKVAKRTTARAGANARFWDCYDDEYYRFPLHRDNNGNCEQHQLLLDADAPGVQAMYCAPLLHTRGALVDAIRKGSVIERSAVIPVASLGPAPFGSPHSVSYPVNELMGEPTLHSNPKRGKLFQRSDLERLRTERRRQLSSETFETLSDRILEKKRRRRRSERAIEAEDPVAAAYLRASAVAFDELRASLIVLPSD
jgi:hypothetical protein